MLAPATHLAHLLSELLVLLLLLLHLLLALLHLAFPLRLLLQLEPRLEVDLQFARLQSLLGLAPHHAVRLALILTRHTDTRCQSTRDVNQPRLSINPGCDDN